MRKKNIRLTLTQQSQLAREARTTKLTIAQLSARHDVSQPVVRRILDEAGVPRPRSNGTKRMSLEKRQELERCLAQSSDTDSELSRLFGVTHQRIAQIRAQIGLPNVRNPESKVFQDRQARSAARKRAEQAQGDAYRYMLHVKRRERLEKIKELWDKGTFLRDIAEEMGTTKALLTQQMFHLRKRYPGELPLRRPCYSKKRKIA